MYMKLLNDRRMKLSKRKIEVQIDKIFGNPFGSLALTKDSITKYWKERYVKVVDQPIVRLFETVFRIYVNVS